MAKRYIPGISGLLTEPNPTDSPSNTLSEAENVVVEQRGKVQARHGFNSNDPHSRDVYDTNLGPIQTSNIFKTLPSIPTLNKRSRLKSINKIETLNIPQAQDNGNNIDSALRILYLKYEDYSSFTNYNSFSVIDVVFVPRETLWTLDEIINYANDKIVSLGLSLDNDIIFKQENGYLILESNHYIEMYKNTDTLTSGTTKYDNLISLFGFKVSQYSYAEDVFDHLSITEPASFGSYSSGNYVKTSNYVSDLLFDTKLFEFNNNTDRYMSGLLVKQSQNLFKVYQYYSLQLKQNKNTVNKYRYYYIDESSSKFIAQNELPYNEITNLFFNKNTMYLQTENGLVESNINDLFQPSTERFFNIRWPSFPEIQYKFRKSDLFENWFWSGYKIGLRYTFYRELGYDNQENIVYESEPSRIYEIFNDGEDSILDIQFVFNTIMQDSEIYKQFNQFTSLNNGRKFGIKLYRTKLTPILDDENEAFPLETDYYQCYDFIPFETIFTTKIKHEKENPADDYDDYSFESIGTASRYQFLDTRGQFNIGDIITYLPNNKENNLGLEYTDGSISDVRPLDNGYIFSKKNVQYNTQETDVNDLELAKLKIVDKFIADRTERDISPIDVFFPSEYLKIKANLYNTNQIRLYPPFIETDLEKKLGLNMRVVGDHIPDNTYISSVSFNSSYVSITLTNSVTETAEDVILTVLPGNQQLLSNSNGAYYEINNSSNQNSQNVGFSIKNVEIFDKYINTIEFFIYECKITPSMEITVEVWDGVDYNSDPFANEYDVKLGNLISTKTISNISVVDNYADYRLNENAIYSIFTDDPLDLNNPIKDAKLKFTLSEAFKWEANSSLFVSISFTDQFSNQSYIKILKSFIADSLTSYLPFDYDRTSNIIAYWKDGETPTRPIASALSTMQYNEHVMCLSRAEDVFHYNLEALTVVQDEGRLDAITTTLNPGDKLKRTLFSYAPEEFGITGIIGINNSKLLVQQIGFSPFIQSFLYENMPISFNTIPVGITGIATGQTYYLTRNPIIHCDYTAGDPWFVSREEDPKLEVGWVFGATVDGTDYTFAIAEIDTVDPKKIKLRIANQTEIFTPTTTGSFLDDIYSIGTWAIKPSLNSYYPVRIKGTATSIKLSINITNLDQLTRYRAFIKDYKVSLEFNDNALVSIGQRLYTNPNADGIEFINLIAPKAKTIVPFKDFYIYAGIELPLTASFTVIEQAATEQLVIGVPTFGPIPTSRGPTVYYKNVFELDDPDDVAYVVNCFATQNSDILTTVTNPYTRDFRVGNYLRGSNISGGKIYHIPDDTVIEAISYNADTSLWEIKMSKPFPTGYVAASPQDTMPVYSNPESIRIPLLKSSNVFELNSLDKNLFIESSFIKNRPIEIDLLTYQDYEYVDSEGTTASVVTDANVGTVQILTDLCDDISMVRLSKASSAGTILFPETKRYQFGATIFERPYLTLKLTSTTSEVNYISIQLSPSYNRQGYYPLIGRNGEFDNKYLQANNAISELNYTQPVDTEISSAGNYNYRIYRYGLVPGMVEGTQPGQCESDAQYNVTTILQPFSITASSTNKIFYNATENTLTFNNIDRFAKDVFKEPGMLLMQMYDGSLATPAVTGYAIFYYTNITTESSNKHIFKNVVIKYMSANGRQFDIDPSLFSSMLGTTFNMWFMPGTTEEGLPLYAFDEDQVNYISIYKGTSITQTSEYHNDSALSDAQIPFTRFPTKPTLVFKPHKDYESPAVAVLNKDGNITFFGAAAQDYSSALQDYSWSIVEAFNRELQNKGIKAYLRKGAGTGQVDVIYPDGQLIELLNGLYDPDTGEITGYGEHEFSPAINKDSFTKIAVRNDKQQYSKNEIRNTLRGVPEITPLACSNVLGKDTKEIIGAAQSVDDLYIFKEDGIFRLTDSGGFIPILTESTYQFSTTSICISGKSIQEINNEIIYLDENGFMSIVDGGIQNISGAIQRDILTLIQTTPKERIRSFKNESKGLYYCTLINEVDATLGVKSGTYIFSTKTRQWTFMNEEILDGIETSKHSNLTVYKQKETELLLTNSFRIYNNAYAEFAVGQNKLITDYTNYFVTRELFTDNLRTNPKDQYDWRCTVQYNTAYPALLPRTYASVLYLKFLLLNQTAYANDLIKYKYDTISAPFFEHSVGSAINLLSNKIIKLIFRDTMSIPPKEITTTAKLAIVKMDYTDYSSSKPYVEYRFEFIESIQSNVVYNELEILIGVPAKITFNPESGNNPDTNKLFQEYMIHTETTNKGAAMAFKTDSRADFSQDRNFRYDANATNRNVFRTYIPTKMSRGRYLIRQVKHDVPLENLIITGQTMVIRDSGNTRVQKNGDDE